MNRADQEPEAYRRFQRWEELLDEHSFRDEPVIALAKAMRVASGKIKFPEGTWEMVAGREMERYSQELELLSQTAKRINEELGAKVGKSFAERFGPEVERICQEMVRISQEMEWYNLELELRSQELGADVGGESVAADVGGESYAECTRQRLAAELQRVLDDALAGRPDAATQFEQFAEAARRVAKGAKERGVNLETRALLAFARASNEFRERPAKDRVVAMVAEELGKSKLPKGTENKVRATIDPLYKP